MNQSRRLSIIASVEQYMSTGDINQLIEDIEIIMEMDLDETIDHVIDNGWEGEFK